MSSPLFSIVICTYQRYDLLPQAIDSALAQDIAPALFDIWVMDNSPDSDQRAQMAQRYQNTPRLHYILLDRSGLSYARNQAFGLSDAPYMAFLDDDAVAEPHWLSAYHDVIKQSACKIGALGGKIIPHFEVPRPSWLSPLVQGPLSILDCADHVMEFPSPHHPFGANTVIAREAYLDSGMFDQNLGRMGDGKSNLLSGEETVLFNSMRDHGWKLIYTPFAQVTHFIPAERTTRAWLRRRMAWQAISEQKIKPLAEEDILPSMAVVFQYLDLVPEEHKPFMGLFWDTEDPDIFMKQLTAITHITRLMISTGKYPDQIRF